jgi:hypothetical protein
MVRSKKGPLDIDLLNLAVFFKVNPINVQERISCSSHFIPVFLAAESPLFFFGVQ